jgi:hypothetical protein
MVGEAQVIIGAEVEGFLAVNHQPGALRAANGADAVVQACLLQRVNFFLDPVQSVCHTCHLINWDS